MNKRIWVGLYLASFAIFVIALLAVGIVLLLQMDQVIRLNEMPLTIVFVLGGLAYLQFVLVHTIYNFVLLAKMWGPIQDGINPITVGKAIGFLFIPVFSVYWIFRAWGSFPTEYNNFLDRYGLAAPRIPSSLFVLYPALILLSALFVLPILVLPIVTAFVIARACDAVNNLAIAKAAAAERRLPQPNMFVGTPENPRSKIPVISAVALVGLSSLFLVVFGVFAYINQRPRASADVVPPKVGEFDLKPNSGYAIGSILGLRSTFSSNDYLSNGSPKKALEYTVSLYSRESEAVKDYDIYASYCDSSPSKGKVLDSAGKEVGAVTYCTKRLILRNGKKVIHLDAPTDYQLKETNATAATANDMLSFAKALPFNSGISITDLAQAPATPTNTTSPSSPSSDKTPAVARDAKPDFTMTSREFYEDTQGAKQKAAMTKYKDKVVEITGRAYSTQSSSVMIQAGKDSFFANFLPANLQEFSNLKKDERVTVKCTVEAAYTIRLSGCILMGSKGVISADDKPDYTFTADAYYNETQSSKLTSEQRIKSWDKYRGTIIKVSGKVKLIGGEPFYLTAGDNWVTCKPDDENRNNFLKLIEGQDAILLGVGGVTSTLDHCMVLSKE